MLSKASLTDLTEIGTDTDAERSKSDPESGNIFREAFREHFWIRVFGKNPDPDLVNMIWCI